MNDTQRYAVYHANDMLETHLPPAMRWYADKAMYYSHVADVVAYTLASFLQQGSIEPLEENLSH